jgi:acyl carrier protein
MDAEREAMLDRVIVVIRRTFRLTESVEIMRETTSADIAGWDSLSHALLIMGIEEEFSLILPLDRMYELGNVGELLDVIRNVQAAE